MADSGDSNFECSPDPRFTNYEMIDGTCTGNIDEHLCEKWQNNICPTWDEMISYYYQSSQSWLFYKCKSGYIPQHAISDYINSEESETYTFDKNGKMTGRLYSLGIGAPFCCDNQEVYVYTIGDINCFVIPMDPPPDPNPDSPAAPATEDSASKPAPTCGCTSTGLSSALALLPLLLLTRRRQGQP